jgi:uroporphyrinogen-III synthase
MNLTKNSIFLFSKTPHSDVIHVPILDTLFSRPEIDFSRYDAIVITSKQAVSALEKISPGWKALPVLSVSSKTSEKVESAGGKLLETGGAYGDSLADIIIKKYASYRWLYPRPRVVASDFAESVAKAGVKIDDVIVYESSCNQACQNIELPDDATLIFTSPSTVACFLELFAFKTSHKVVAIGKTTAKALPAKVKYCMPDEATVDAAVLLAQKL